MDFTRTALSIPSLLTTQPGLLEPPAAPELAIPKLLAVPEPGFRDRLAAGLAAAPGYTPQAYESRGSRFGRGLLAGAEQGFSRGRLLAMKGEEERVAARNAVERASADRANTIANETWRAKLSDYYKTKADRAGKLEVTKEISDDTGLPVGSFEEPVRIATLRNQRERDAETKRHNLKVEQGRSPSRLLAHGPQAPRTGPAEATPATAPEKPKKAPKLSRSAQGAVDFLRNRQGITSRAQAEAYFNRPEAKKAVENMRRDGINLQDVLNQFPK